MSLGNTTTEMPSSNASSGDTVCTWNTSSEAARLGKIAGYSLVLVISLVANILVILVVYKNKNMRKTINFFIVNMAISDLIVPILVMPLQISRTVLDTEFGSAWPVDGQLGLALCKLIVFLSDISGPVSILSLVCMAVDRFVGVVFPLRAGIISSRVRKGMIIVTWIVAVGFYAPYLYIFKLERFNGRSYCKIEWSEDRALHTRRHQAYFTAQAMVFFLIPLVLLVLLYGVILITLAKRKFPRLHQSTEARQRNRRVSRSATVIAFTVVMVFQFCWCPYNIIMFLWAFKWNWIMPSFCGFRSIFFAFQFFTWAYAAINPCIYFILVENYRKGLRTVIPRSMSVNSSLRGQRSTKQETQEAGVADCIELVEQ